jgi:hypothetical protein
MSYFATRSASVPVFDPQSRGFTADTAWWLAKFSQLAYEDKAFAAQALEQAGFDEVTFFDMYGTQAFLAHHPGAIPNGAFAVLAFRGTENDWTDILTDIDFVLRKISDKGYRGHGGFVMGLKSVWGTSFGPPWPGRIRVKWLGAAGISDALALLQNKVPLYFTGHSLGAALATLAAHLWRPRALYTFGSPRAAETALANLMNGQPSGQVEAYRVVNSTDIVARVPLPLGFKHVGQLVYFTRGGQLCTGGKAVAIAVLEFIREILAVATRLLPYRLVRWISPRLFTNHKISEYVRKLEAEI